MALSITNRDYFFREVLITVSLCSYVMAVKQK